MSTSSILFGPVVQVESFRRPGMGDAQVIQAAIEHAFSIGGAVVGFEARTYSLSETVRLKSNVSLDGNGATITWPDRSSAFSFFWAEAVSNVHIEDFNFQWRSGRSASPTPQTHAVVIQSSRNVTVEESKFHNSKAIHVVASTDIVIQDNVILGGLEGIVVGSLTSAAAPGPTKGVQILRNRIEGQVREAIDLNSDAHHVLIADNILAGGGSGRDPMADELIDVGGGAMSHVVIENNVFDGRGTHAFGLRVKLQVDDLKIEGNTFDNFANIQSGSAIHLANISNFTVQDNQIGAARTAVSLEGAVTGTMAGNEVTGTATNPISFAANFSGFTSAPTMPTRLLDQLVEGQTNVAATSTNNPAGQLIQGSRGVDLLYGGAGNDTIVGGLGDDWLDGGHGIDVARFSGERQQYTVMRGTGNTYNVAGPEGWDRVAGIEFLAFNDKILPIADAIYRPPIAQIPSSGPELVSWAPSFAPYGEIL